MQLGINHTQGSEKNLRAIDNRPDTTSLGGWPHVRLSRVEFAKLMAEDCEKAKSSLVAGLPKLAFSMNGQALSLCATDKEFEGAMKTADYIQADGESLVKASRILGVEKLPERIATTDFFHDAAEIASEKGLRFYFLGGSEDVIGSAKRKVLECYPDLDLVGARHGYFSPDEEAAICKEIVALNVDVLWVGLGKPKEQVFCIRNHENLRGVGWIKTCGGLFDFLAGRNVRAPKWMQDAGLEWLHRTLQDPGRFFVRYLTTNVHTIYLLLKNRKGKRSE